MGLGVVLEDVGDLDDVLVDVGVLGGGGVVVDILLEVLLLLVVVAVLVGPRVAGVADAAEFPYLLPVDLIGVHLVIDYRIILLSY